jgi:hypothetical protein
MHGTVKAAVTARKRAARGSHGALPVGQFGRAACGSEHPRVSVYSKCDNRVALLVGRMEKAPCRVEANETWDPAKLSRMRA